MYTLLQLYMMVRSSASNMDIDEDIFGRLILNESSFQIDAISPTGCRGLGQISPVWDYDPEMLVTMPAYNLAASVRIFKLNLRHFHGNYYLAVLGYNMGTKAADDIYGLYGLDWRKCPKIPPATLAYIERVVDGEWSLGDAIDSEWEKSKASTVVH